jgi:anti-anti-sigma factor
MITFEQETTVHSSAMGSTWIIRVGGELRLERVSLDRELARVSACRPPLVWMDLGELSFISTLGMGMLVAFHKTVKSYGGTLTITGLQPRVLGSLQRARLDRVLNCVASLSVPEPPADAETWSA